MHISVATVATDSAMCTSLSHCEHLCHSAVSCDQYHTSVHSNVTALSLASFVAALSVYFHSDMYIAVTL